MKKIWLLTIMLPLSLPSISEAGTTSWSYSTYANGSYVPKSGTFTESITSNGQYTCKTSFQFDSYNVTQISDYNNGGDNPGTTSCDNARAYVTIDQTAVPDSWDLEIDADSITSNLPNPKYDLEDNNGFAEDDESEVVALDPLTANVTYYARTYWNDYRDGDSGDSGNIQTQFAMSKLGVSDYNNCTTSAAVQIINPYGDNLGDQ